MNPFVDPRIPTSAHVSVMLGVILGAAFSGLVVLFVGGEILSDPGGIQGVILVVAWLVVPVVLAVLALLRPRWAYPPLVIAVVAVLLASLATIPFARETWEFEDTHGPINLMVLIGALIPLVALGRAAPSRAGWLMMAAIAGTIVLQGISLGLVDEWSVILVFLVLMPPYVATSILFIVAGRRARRDSNPQPTG